MKKTIKSISILLVITVIIQLFAFHVFADDAWNPFSENKEREQLVLEALANGTPLPPENDDVESPTQSTRWLCADCGWFMPVVFAAETTAETTDTREYGIFTKDTSAVTERYSNAAYVCPTCYKIDSMKEVSS